MDVRVGLWRKCWRIDAFELWYWRILLRVPWTARRSNQCILKEISPEYSLEGLMLKLKFQCLGNWCEEPTHWKRPRCWERLKVGGEGDDRQWDRWMVSLTQWTWVLNKLWELVMDREAWHAAIHGVAKTCTRLSDWTALTDLSCGNVFFFFLKFIFWKFLSWQTWSCKLFHF